MLIKGLYLAALHQNGDVPMVNNILQSINQPDIVKITSTVTISVNVSATSMPVGQVISTDYLKKLQNCTYLEIKILTYLSEYGFIVKQEMKLSC